MLTLIRGAGELITAERWRMAWTAWHSAIFSRVKTIPPFDDVLAALQIEKPKVQDPSPAELERKMEGIFKAFGGAIKKIEPEGRSQHGT